jgi:TolB-like protein/Tfp pilus assembly protein PilF
MSRDPEQEYFSDGIAEDLITDLSKISGLLVIARHSSFAYKGRVTSVRKVAENLSVRYVVEGSVRRSGRRIRINVQLIDAETDAHLWAERYDRDVEDIFAVQDEVVAEIVEVLKLTLGQIDGGGERPASLEAHECLLRGRDLCQRFTADENAKAKEWLEKAVQLDPNYAQAHLWLAFCHWMDWQCNWSRAETDALEAASRVASRAVELDPREPLAHAISGLAHLYRRELTKSIRAYEEALRLQPNQPDVLVFLSELLTMDGRPLEGIKCSERAIRLNPHHPDVYLWELAWGQYLVRRYEDAVANVRRMTSPGVARRILAASLAQLGRTEEARAEAEKFLQDNPSFSAHDWGRTQPFRHDADRQHCIEGYIKAGLPA